MIIGRRCANCGSAWTYLDKNWWSHWYRNGNDFWCANCHIRKKISPARVVFNGKQVHLSYNPRAGICAVCNRRVDEGEIQTTNLHHLRYDAMNPLAHTIEVCARDHRLIHSGKLEVMTS